MQKQTITFILPPSPSFPSYLCTFSRACISTKWGTLKRMESLKKIHHCKTVKIYSNDIKVQQKKVIHSVLVNQYFVPISGQKREGGGSKKFPLKWNNLNSTYTVYTTECITTAQLCQYVCIERVKTQTYLAPHTELGHFQPQLLKPHHHFLLSSASPRWVLEF